MVLGGALLSGSSLFSSFYQVPGLGFPVSLGKVRAALGETGDGAVERAQVSKPGARLSRSVMQ